MLFVCLSKQKEITCSSINLRFLGLAATVSASFEGILEEKIAAITAFGVTLTATAAANNSTWPFVTIDQFQQRSASSLSLSGCLFLELAPIVTDENRVAWEDYSVANTGWLTEGRQYQAEKGLGSMVGGDPYINKQIVSLDESGTVFISEPKVSSRKKSTHENTLFGTLTRFFVVCWLVCLFRSSAVGTVFSHLAVISCLTYTPRHCQLQLRDAASIWNIYFCFGVHGTDCPGRTSYGSTGGDLTP